MAKVDAGRVEQEKERERIDSSPMKVPPSREQSVPKGVIPPFVPGGTFRNGEEREFRSVENEVATLETRNHQPFSTD